MLGGFGKQRSSQNPTQHTPQSQKQSDKLIQQGIQKNL